MNPVDSIENKYSQYSINKCEENGCCINFRNMPKRVCLKGEKLSTGSICDGLLFYSNANLITAAIELKSGSWDLQEVIKQLSNGSKMILAVLGKCSITALDVEFYPILMLNKGPKNSSEKKKFRQAKIVFNQIKYSLLSHRCGTEFLEIRRLTQG